MSSSLLMNSRAVLADQRSEGKGSVYLQVISRTGSKGTADAAEQELRLRHKNKPEFFFSVFLKT